MSGARQGPDYKHQFMEVAAGEAQQGENPVAGQNKNQFSGRASHSLPFKAQVQSNESGAAAAANHDFDGAPIVQAVAVDSTITGPTPASSRMSGTTTTDEFVMKISKRTIYWSVGLLLVIAGAAVGGFCASGKCSSTSSTGDNKSIMSGADPLLGAPSLRPVAAPLSPTTVNAPQTSPVSPTVSVPSSAPVLSPVSVPVLAPSSQAVDPAANPVAPSATSCLRSSDCPLGVCARESLTSPSQVCCPSGDSNYIFRPISEDVCTGQATGAACSTDSICSSNVCFQSLCLAAPQVGGSSCDSNNDCTGVCVQGTCTEGSHAEVGGPCDESSDCIVGDCAHETVSTGKICCPTGDSVYLSRPIAKDVCTGQLSGAACRTSDVICQSGACLEGLCLERLQNNGEACDSNADCVGVCIGGLCDTGFQPPGATCDESSDCANGKCAYETASELNQVCCPSGVSTYLSSPISRYVCTKQLAGAVCGNSDIVCESGVCFEGICQAGKLANGEACDNNVDCRGTCVQKVCVEGFIGNDETCDDDEDCANEVCAFQTVSAGKVCCPAGSSEYLSSPIRKYVCSGQESGAPCGTTDQVCASRVCIAGSCASSQQAAGEPCDSNSDCRNTCVNGACTETSRVALGEVCDDGADCSLFTACAASTATATETICCSSGESVYLSSPISKSVCTNQETGAACGSRDLVCASNTCVDGACA